MSNDFEYLIKLTWENLSKLGVVKSIGAMLGPFFFLALPTMGKAYDQYKTSYQTCVPNKDPTVELDHHR